MKVKQNSYSVSKMPPMHMKLQLARGSKAIPVLLNQN